MLYSGTGPIIPTPQVQNPCNQNKTVKIITKKSFVLTKRRNSVMARVCN